MPSLVLSSAHIWMMASLVVTSSAVRVSGPGKTVRWTGSNYDSSKFQQLNTLTTEHMSCLHDT